MLQPREPQAFEGSAVEATGYALMTYILNNRMREAEPIMRWLQTQRNVEGGFASTRVIVL